MNDDREEIWKRIAIERPEFLRSYDVTNNHHAVREIVLGGSIPWAGFHTRFKPFSGSKVLDIGANVGIFSAYCAANGAEVTAYEPHPTAFHILKELTNVLPIKPVNVAAWSSRGTALFRGHIFQDEEYVQYNGALQSEQVHWNPNDFESALEAECVPFDEIIGSTLWDCVKVDIEGAEFDILRNITVRTASQIKFMFVELHPWVTRELYDATIERLQFLFKFEGAYKDSDGHRWESIYLWGK